MKVQGRYTLKAPRERVWKALLDPQVLVRCIPGCDALEPAGENRYRAVLELGIAGIKGTFHGQVTLTDLEPPERYRMQVEGEGAPGFVRGEGRLTLREKGGQTEVQVDGEAVVGGLVASVGQRLLGMVARQLLGQFFRCMDRQVSQG